jgi:hypothetical protein
MWVEHYKKIIFSSMVVAFILYRYGYVDKGDLHQLIGDIVSIVHDFKQFVTSFFK